MSAQRNFVKLAHKALANMAKISGFPTDVKQLAKEAEKQVIEAQGKADGNRILAASLTPNILRDKGIEATLILAQSPNAKIVVVGSGKDGLPLILGNN